ncbi:MAG TPA: hypothetical protein VKF32_00345 [Thermoanaerobaculia bacterium]|nr:hypothetical protein [Thermoanaerobaculia bacterium]
MPDVIEREGVSTEAAARPPRQEASTCEIPESSGEKLQQERRVFGGLEHQVEEEDWLI